MQAQDLYQSKLQRNSCIYPSRNEYADTNLIPVIENLCTYPSGIEYASAMEAVEIRIETKVTPVDTRF